VRWASGIALAGLVLASTVPSLDTIAARAAAGASLLVATGFALRWAARWSTPRFRRVLTGLLVASVVGALVFSGTATIASLAVVPATALLKVETVEPGKSGWLGALVDHPARLVVSTFAALCLSGTALLALPASSASGASIGLVDAAFTSISAVCVTGLIVLDTPNAFTGFGQAAILLLIQLGGLGIMSLYTVALQAFGKRLSLRHELTVAGAVGAGAGRLFGALRRVLLVTASAELLGALLLGVAFRLGGDSLPQAIWRGVFTAVSAFCNAGFALQSDSLVAYQTNLLVMHTVAGLIVLGGLSPLALVLLPRFVRRAPTPLQVKLVYTATLSLLALGTAAYAAFEWSDSLGHLSRWQRLHNAWFQSVTLRTAGFNSVDLSETREVTRTLMLIFMFIGGSPGGTAGGLKTTTVAVLVLAVAAALRGRSHVVAFGRHIRHATVYKAAAVATLGALSVVTAIAAVQLTQTLPFDVGVFEVFSAIGTVGLSLGATARLDEVGKVLIMACMFMGRVGPLTLFLFLVDRRPDPDWDYPDEDVDVG
jgi:trk system potassium uptake protein TrkH